MHVTDRLCFGLFAFTVCVAFSASACREGGGSFEAPASQPPAATAVIDLWEGLADSGSLANGQRRIYRAELAAGQFLEIETEQRGVDFKLDVTGPGGLRLSADSPNSRHGPERLLLWADAAGRYEVEMVATDAEADPRFALRVVALHAGSERERRRAEAFALGMEADRQRRSGVVGERACAIATYKREAVAWRTLGEVQGEAHALDGLVRAARSLHDRPEQIEASRQLAVLHGQTGKVAKQAEALVDLGEALLEQDRRRPAQEAFREALRLLPGAPHAETEARAWNALANACQKEGQLGQAREGFERSLALWRRLGRSQSEAITRANLAFLLAELGEPRLALDELGRARKALPDPPSPGDEAFLLAREVDTWIRLGRLDDKVRQMAQRAVAMQRELGDPRALANTLSTQALFEYQTEAFSQAEKLFLEARRAMLQAGDPSGAAQNLISTGWCRVRSCNWPAAGAAFAQALPVLEAAGNPREAAAALAGLAWVERQRGDLQNARQHALAAVSLIEALRSSTGRLDLRASLLADRQQFFDLAVDVLMLLQARTGDGRFAAEAFAVSERAHGRFLLEALPGGGAAEPEASKDLDLRADRVGRLDTACRNAQASGAAETALRACDTELRSALDQLRDAQAATTAVSVARPVSLAEAQRELLADGSQLLLYDLGRTRSYLWVVSSRAVHTFVLPEAAEIERRALGVYRALAASQGRTAWFEAERRSAALAAELLEPALPFLTGRRLLIVREGALLYVPFSALTLPASREPPRQPLLARYEVSYLPSASVGVWMRRLRKGVQSAGLDVVALGHPIPTPGFSPLPFSAAEARAVAAAAPRSRGRAFLGSEAVKEVLTRNRLGGPRFLHLAAHGFSDDRYPELSGLVFAARDEQGRTRDGVLRAYEVARLRLRCELVVLSACDSGLGAQIPGEGLVGLPHAFLRAGAGKVLASLWRVNDPAAPALMIDLYQGLLQEGLTPEGALQRAQLKLAEHPKWRQPYYWAGFVLVGAG